MNKQTDIEIVTKKFALIKIAIDMQLRNYRVVGQIEYSRPQPGQKFAPEAIYGWLEKQRALAEAGGRLLRSGLFWV